MQKILIVITKAEMGGAQSFVLNLAKALKQNNIDLLVGFGEGEYLKSELERNKIPYVIFQSLKRTKNPLVNLRFIWEIKKFIENQRIEVVHFNSSNSLFGAMGARLAKNKPKKVFTFHGLSVLDPNYKSPLKILYWLAFKLLLIFVDEKVFVSRNNLEYTQKKGLVKNGHVVYNGLDLKDSNFLTSEEARKFLSAKLNAELGDRFIVGSIGRLAYPKNYEFLINTFPDILKAKPDAVCVIIGEGPERNKYESLIKENSLGVKVYLAGEIKDAYRYLKAFDIFVLPSIYEGLSISLIETTFAKVPALASDVGGNSEILDQKNLYRTNDKKEFLEKLKYISFNSKDKSKEFSTESMVKKYLGIYGKD